MNKKLATTIALALLVLGMTFSGAAQSLSGDNDANTTDGDERENQSSNITVGITSTTAIDVKPTSLDYPNMDVGTQATLGQNGANEFGSIELENIGSEYIDRVWAGATTLDNGPFGTGDAANYDAGNFLQIKPSNATQKSSVRGNTSTYHYVNRKEFANSWTGTSGEIPSYIQADPSVAYSGSPVDSYVGRFRAGDEWYFYAIYSGLSGSNDVCDGTGSAEVRIGDTPHSTDQFGTVDFEDGSDFTTYNVTQTSGSYGIATDGPSGETGVRLEFTDSSGNNFYREYDLLTVCDTSKSVANEPHTIRTRYNPQAGDVTDLESGAGSRTQFLLDAGSSSPDTMLLPGEGITVDTAVEVPQGVPEGSVGQGQITFYVTSDADAQVSN